MGTAPKSRNSISIPGAPVCLPSLISWLGGLLSRWFTASIHFAMLVPNVHRIKQFALFSRWLLLQGGGERVSQGNTSVSWALWLPERCSPLSGRCPHPLESHWSICKVNRLLLPLSPNVFSPNNHYIKALPMKWQLNTWPHWPVHTSKENRSKCPIMESCECSHIDAEAIEGYLITRKDVKNKYLYRQRVKHESVLVKCVYRSMWTHTWMCLYTYMTHTCYQWLSPSIGLLVFHFFPARKFFYLLHSLFFGY